jgi:HSP20 family protein
MANRITRWNPLRDMATMQTALDRIFEDTVRSMNDAGNLVNSGHWLALDVFEQNDVYIVKADVPGLLPEDIEVTVQKRTLTISGEVARDDLPDDTRELLRERVQGRFSRSITLPEHIDIDHVEATCQDGVLTLTLPKADDAKPRQITVNSPQVVSAN